MAQYYRARGKMGGEGHIPNTEAQSCGDLIFVMHNPIYHLHMGNVAILNKLLHVLAVISRFKTTPSAGESQICRQTLV